MRKLLAILAVIFMLPPSLAAQDAKPDFEGLLNKLLAPGPLVIGHENLEHKDCLKCHEPGGGVPNANCVSCHKPIGEHIAAGKHFHGLMNGRPCIDCHKEHKGREFNLAPVPEKTFDHNKTGFNLDGGHANVSCAKCHNEKRTQKPIRKNDPLYFGKVNSCKQCHASDDIHFFEGKFRTKECSNCHVTKTWKDTHLFNHGRETGYNLVGNHAQQKCSKCHVSEGKNNIKYDWPRLNSQKCLTCHVDHHGAKLSPKFRTGDCASCHSQDDWKIHSFNHEVTGFKLAGSHAQLQCVQCHKQPAGAGDIAKFNWQGLKKACSSCHADFHGYGKEQGDLLRAPLKACETCHSDVEWKQNLRFDHGSQTRFPITGKHKGNQCFECHVPKGPNKATKKANVLRTYFFKELSKKSCETCHKSPHTKSFQTKFKGIPCQMCHSTEGWNITNLEGEIAVNPTFHSRTRFLLDGSHLKVSCKSCHNSKGKEQWKFPSADKKFCQDCHNTPHKNQFSEKTQEKSCASCHATTKFENRLPFDHDTTGFKLTGQHKSFETNCFKCHIATNQKLPTKIPKVAHLFQFNGSKDPNLCASCHVSVHKKQFSEESQKKSCASCHVTTSFAKLQDFNHDVTRFKLTGKHEKIGKSCASCHKLSPSIVLPTKPPRKGHQYMFPGESKNFCENCHANQHKDMFSTELASKPCTECHSTESFDKRLFFDHDKRTDFDLKGKHLKVSCAQCHVPTKERYKKDSEDFKGKYAFPEIKAKNCQTCHKDVHNGTNGGECTKCHNESGWKNAGEFHKDFQLTGVHLQMECKSCHESGRLLKGSSQECSVCHSKDDNHNGQLPRCAECHTQNFWEHTLFDHNMTRYPLTGAHRVTECKACHNQGVYQGLPTDCRGCHQQEALNILSPNHNSPRFFKCDLCHTTFGFPGAQVQ